MNQMSRLQAIDARLHRAFARKGLAGVGMYTDGTTSTEVRVYVDKGTRTVGQYAPSYAHAATITLLRADVPDPIEGATVEVDGETWTLRTPIHVDDGISQWGCV